jgi:hypothetical protein
VGANSTFWIHIWRQLGRQLPPIAQLEIHAQMRRQYRNFILK